jgi:multiple sugar transport system substrate-binding protein
MSRRKFLHAALVTAAGTAAAACQPKTVIVEKEVEREVTKVVKEVIKETVIVEGTPKVVEKEVTKVVKEVVKETVVVEATPVSKEPVELVWYRSQRPLTIKQSEEVIIPRYEELNPDIKIKMVIATWEELVPKLVSMNAAGRPPDCFGSWMGGPPQQLRHGMLLPLDDLIDASPIIDMDEYPEQVVDFFTTGGHTFCIPYMITASYMFYNKDLFDEAGVEYPPSDWNDKSWTWGEMVTRAKKLTKNYGQGADAVYGIQNVTLRNRQDVEFKRWGTSMFDDQYKDTGYPCEVNLTGDIAMACLQGQVDVMYKDKVSPPPSEVDAISAGGNPFLTGKVAMNYTGGWQFNTLMGFDGFRWGVAAVPYKESNVNSLFPDGNVVARLTEHPQEAWSFTEYISTGEALKGLLLHGGQWPCADKYLDEYSEAFSPMVNPEEFRRVWLGGIGASMIPGSHDHADWNRFSQRIGAHFDAMWLGEKSVEETVGDAQAELQAITDETCGNSILDDVKKYVG